MRIEVALKGVTRLAFDTSPILYFVEENLNYLQLMNQIFQQIDDGEIIAITSTISVIELLVIPIRTGNHMLTAQYTDLLIDSGFFLTYGITTDIAKTGAELRAKYALKTPDALQLAVAIQSGCQAFLTNDKDLLRVTELKVLLVGSLSLN